ncbi:MAG: hypothetical protein AAFX58_10870, partial [Pseudomonadota bacterium]
MTRNIRNDISARSFQTQVNRKHSGGAPDSLGKGSQSRQRGAIWWRFTLLAALLSAAPLRAEWTGESRPMLGTEISVYLWHEDAGRARELV